MTPVYLCALLAQRHARRHGHHVTRIVSPQVPRKEKSIALGAVLAAGLIAALACGCERAVAPRTEIPPSPSSAAPVHAWCGECRDLPVANLGREPRIRRASR